MIVAKFGGSSLSSAEGYLKVAELIKRHNIPVVVVSAPGGKPKVTDLLISAYREWENTGNLGSDFDEADFRLNNIAKGLGYDISALLRALKADISAGCGYDYAVSRGEFFSAYLLSKALDYNFVDAKECIKFTNGGKIDLCSTRAHSVNIKPPCVIPGFYGFLPSGKLKLFDRGGSDISGALIASILGAEYWKCTDVEGIFDGYGGVLDNISYDEAELLCYFGATVMQYESLAFLKRARTKLIIRGTCINKRGTIVSSEPSLTPARSSKQMLYAENIDVRYVEDSGLKVAVSASLLGKTVALIDGMDFSPAAIERILGKNALPVKATAAVGPFSQDEAVGKPFIATTVSRLYIEDI